MVAIEISIKNNEDKVLSLEECVYMIDKIGVSSSPSSQAQRPSNGRPEKFTVKMFAALERHMLHLLAWKINIPTPIDFALFFAHRAFNRDDAQFLVRMCIPWFYFVALNYELARLKRPSAIALAALCHQIQHVKRLHNEANRDRLLIGVLHKTELMEQTSDLL